MSNRRLRIESPIRVTVTPSGSPDLREQRRPWHSTKFQSSHLSPGLKRKNVNIKQRPRSGSPHCLQVPGAKSSPINSSGRAENLKDNPDDNTSQNRSRSYSPFHERKQIPCGSPTFERVLRDMLSESSGRGGLNHNGTNRHIDTDLQQLSLNVKQVSIR